MNDFKAFLSLRRSLLIFWFPNHFWLPHFLFFRLSSWETTTNVKDSTLTVFFFILSTWRNYSSLLFCKHSLRLRLFNFSLILSSSGELLSSDPGIIQKKSASGSRTLPCLVIFFRNFILIWKCQKWYLNRCTLVLVTKQSALLQV